MQQSKIFEVLKKTGLPVTYKEWPIGEAPQLPYIVFTRRNFDNFVADNVVYESDGEFDIELCTEGKDTAQEDKLIRVFAEEGIIWDWTGEARTDEGIYIVSFDI